jgi:hypothetical protein
MGLAHNIPMIEARQSIVQARAIAMALGSAEVAQQTVALATGDADLAFRIRMNLEHQKAVG